MKVTFTADDGTTFDKEEDCVAYEGISDEVSLIYDTYNCSDPDAALGFQEGFSLLLKEHGWLCAADLMRFRRSFLRLAELLQPLEGRHYFEPETKYLNPKTEYWDLDDEDET